MKFATILKSLLVLTATSLLVACGGGTSGGDSAFQPATLRITANPSANSVRAGGHINVAVKVTGRAMASPGSTRAVVSASAVRVVFIGLLLFFVGRMVPPGQNDSGPQS